MEYSPQINTCSTCFSRITSFSIVYGGLYNRTYQAWPANVQNKEKKKVTRKQPETNLETSICVDEEVVEEINDVLLLETVLLLLLMCMHVNCQIRPACQIWNNYKHLKLVLKMSFLERRLSQILDLPSSHIQAIIIACMHGNGSCLVSFLEKYYIVIHDLNNHAHKWIISVCQIHYPKVHKINVKSKWQLHNKKASIKTK